MLPRKPKPKVIRKSNGVTRIIRANYAGGGEGWAALRERVLKRDGYRCVKCKRSKSLLNAHGVQLQVNHIKLRAAGGLDVMTNLQSECADCHSRNYKHGHLYKQRKAERLKRRRKLIGK